MFRYLTKHVDDLRLRFNVVRNRRGWRVRLLDRWGNLVLHGVWLELQRLLELLRGSQQADGVHEDVLHRVRAGDHRLLGSTLDALYLHERGFGWLLRWR